MAFLIPRGYCEEVARVCQAAQQERRQLGLLICGCGGRQEMELEGQLSHKTMEAGPLSGPVLEKTNPTS